MVDQGSPEKLDLIDNLLSGLDTSLDDENEPEATPKTARVLEKVQGSAKVTFNSPLLTDSTNRKIPRDQSCTHTKLKRSQSEGYSTPKFAINQELDFLNILYNDGSLNDSQLEVDVDDSRISNCTNIAQNSPLINISQQKLKQPSKSDTPIISLGRGNANNGSLDDLSRNLKFEDESEVKSWKKRLEVVEEDEELFSNTQLAHISEIERSVSHDSSLHFGSNDSNRDYSTARSSLTTDSASSSNKENNGSLEVGFKTGSGNSIRIKSRSMLEIKERLFDQEKDSDKIKTPLNKDETKLLEEKQNDPKVQFEGFKTGKGQTIPVSKNALKEAYSRFGNDGEIEEANVVTSKSGCEQNEKMETKSAKSIDLPMQFEGFKTGSGNQIKINGEALEKAKSKYLDSDIKESMQFEGFKPGSGNSIKVNKDALEAAQSKYLDSDNKEPMKFEGFKTGSGNSIKVNKDALALAQSKYLESDTKEPMYYEGFKSGSGNPIQVNKDALATAKSKYLDNESSEPMQVDGFRTGRGNQIKINQGALEKAKSKYLESDTQEPMQFEGFMTGSGNQIKINKDALALAQSKYLDNDEKGTASIEGFKTGSGNLIQINKDALAKAQSKYLDSDIKEPMQLEGFKPGSGNSIKVNKDALEAAQSKKEPMKFEGFKTGSGNSIKISKDAIALAQSKYLDTDKDEPMQFEGFKSGSGNQIKINKDALALAQSKYLETDKDAPMKFEGFKTGSGNSIKINKEALDKARAHLQDDDCHLSNIQDNSTSNLQENVSNNLKEPVKLPVALEIKQPVHVIPEVKVVEKKVPENRNAKGYKRPQLLVKARLNKYVDDSPARASNTVPNEINNNSVRNNFCQNEVCTSKLNNLSDTDPALSSITEGKNNIFFVNNQNQTGVVRFKELRLQVCGQDVEGKAKYVVEPILELINLDSGIFRLFKINPLIQMNCDPELLDGINLLNEDLLIEKLFQSNRAKAFVEQMNQIESKKSEKLTARDRSRPGYLSEMKSTRTRISLTHLKPKKDLSVEYSNPPDFENFKLKLFDFYTVDAIYNSGFVKTPDNSRLVADKSFMVGENEFYNCFRATPGVDLKLIDLNWFRNHMKWIVWKLYSYDTKFKGAFREPNNLSVLNPMNILLQLKYRYDVEIGAARRSCLRKIVEKDDTSANKCLILFVSAIHIQISTNNLIFIELSDGWYSVKALCDTHLTSYVKGKKIRVGDKLALFSCDLINSDKDGCSILEVPENLHLKLSVNCVRKVKWFAKLGFAKPQKPMCLPLRTLKPNSQIGAINCVIERIYPILYVEKFSDGSKVYRNQRQEELAQQKYQTERYKCTSAGEQQSREPVDFLKRNVSESLKIRVADATRSGPNDNRTNAVITVWQNAANLKEELTEGQKIIFLNLASNSQSAYKEASAVFLSTTRQTSFIFSKKNRLVERQDVRGSYSPRCNLEYKCLYDQNVSSPYSEADFCGVVVMHRKSNYHNVVYLTNLAETHSVICICFPINHDFYGFTDLLKVSNTLACLNLKYIRKKELNKYPCLLVNENSLFTQRISQYKFLADQFNTLNSMPNVKTKISEICAKIENDTLAVNAASSAPNPLKKYPSTTNFSNMSVNESNMNDDVKAKKLAAIAKEAQLPPLPPTKNNRRSLTSFKAPFKETGPLLMGSRPLKRTSDIHETLMNNKRREEEEDEDNMLINQDLEALCNNQAKRKKI